MWTEKKENIMKRGIVSAIYFIALFVFLSYGCQSDSKEKASDSGKPVSQANSPMATKTDDDGGRVVERKMIENRSKVFYVKGETEPFSGTAVEYYPKGPISSKFSYRNGIPHGPGLMFYKDGQKMAEAMQENGYVNGLYTEWYPNGKKKKQVTFEQGKKIGIQKEWWENGNIRREETYVDGALHGKVWDYDKKGKLFQSYTAYGAPAARP
jgi:hypothetical protein